MSGWTSQDLVVYMSKKFDKLFTDIEIMKKELEDIKKELEEIKQKIK